MTKQLIFGIGLNKTGTVSLTKALDLLGFPCMHHSRRVSKITAANKAAGRLPLTSLTSTYTAFCDYPICLQFEALDEAYPGSKFIYTTRELASWIRSRRIQFGGTVDYHTDVAADHAARVAAYFAERPEDILTYDLCGGAGWAPLCRFLDVPVPSRNFPRKNVTTPKLRRRRRQQVRRRNRG